MLKLDRLEREMAEEDRALREKDVSSGDEVHTLHQISSILFLFLKIVHCARDSIEDERGSR